MSKVYHWPSSKLLKNYGYGHIIVVAQSVDEAKQKVRTLIQDKIENAKEHMETDINLSLYPYMYQDEREEWDERVKCILDTLEEDLSDEPVEVDGVILIGGSD